MMSLISLEDALARILGRVQPLQGEVVPIGSAEGRILQEDLFARVDLPGWDNSSMDGYAVRSSDLVGASSAHPVRLKLTGSVPAGTVPKSTVEGQECHRVFTGSMLPRGVDAVVMQEDAALDGDCICFSEPVSPFENVRLKGEDMRRGEKIAGVGEPLSLGRLLLAQGAGVAEIRAGRRPVVAVLATGDELLEPGEAPSDGCIYETNRTAICSLSGRAGAIPQSLPLVADDLEITRKALRTAFEAADVVVTSGGASVGEHDWIKQAFTDIGGTLELWRVAIKPGKPFVFGTIGEKLLFGLPGNPVSALVTFTLMVRPALLKLQGAAELTAPFLDGVLNQAITNDGPRRHFVRVRRLMDGSVQSSGLQASHRLVSVAGSTGLVDVPAETTLAAGTKVRVLSWL